MILFAYPSENSAVPHLKFAVEITDDVDCVFNKTYAKMRDTLESPPLTILLAFS